MNGHTIINEGQQPSTDKVDLFKGNFTVTLQQYFDNPSFSKEGRLNTSDYIIHQDKENIVTILKVRQPSDIQSTNSLKSSTKL